MNTTVSDAERVLAERRNVLYELVSSWLEEARLPTERESRWLLEDIELLIKWYDVEEVGRHNLSRARREVGYLRGHGHQVGSPVEHLTEAWRFLGAAQ